MSVESHLASLERRHADLERELHEALQHPSADVLVSSIKRRKLQLKDEIERLKSAITVH